MAFYLLSGIEIFYFHRKMAIHKLHALFVSSKYINCRLDFCIEISWIESRISIDMRRLFMLHPTKRYLSVSVCDRMTLRCSMACPWWGYSAIQLQHCTFTKLLMARNIGKRVRDNMWFRINHSLLMHARQYKNMLNFASLSCYFV